MDPKIFDFEICLPLDVPISEVGRVRAGRLPAATVARTVFRGPYEGLPDAWDEFDAWIAAEGHSPGPEFWECYVAEPESSPDPSAWGTELSRQRLEQDPINLAHTRLR